MEISVFAVLGVIAGVLTTLAGMGGGLFLLVAVGLLTGPHEALALTAPALLVSNAHRVWLFRQFVDRRLAGIVALGVIPGALAGALVLPEIPELVVALLFTASTVLALLRATGRVRIEPGRRWIVVYAVVIGALTATSGGAGMLIAPLVLSTGLTGAAYVATVALCAIAMHVGRVIGYGTVGLLSIEQLPIIATLLAGLVLGNLIGRRLRGSISAGAEKRVELVALVVANLAALANVLR
jgi:uncharacterized protein